MERGAKVKRREWAREGTHLIWDCKTQTWIETCQSDVIWHISLVTKDHLTGYCSCCLKSILLEDRWFMRHESLKEEDNRGKKDRNKTSLDDHGTLGHSERIIMNGAYLCNRIYRVEKSNFKRTSSSRSQYSRYPYRCRVRMPLTHRLQMDQYDKKSWRGEVIKAW